jgi:methylenetetrahydrofolate dehydrogenase (NADP+)/methenyltetrahydrofolate cyclohydrolase
MMTRRGDDATVTITHTGTKNVKEHTLRADIIVAAVGSAHLLTPDMVKPGVVVLDVGITRTPAGLLGDVHPDVSEIASYIAPMPGGVGPMTRAMLLSNVVETAARNSL